ncbi:bifunctional 5,10-methylenetetrahydrofolate dehydrogenase/5,10-methenyltetrahydrofolate cyclohydrolase [Atopobium fossor]|uniref:bifunctional 5,10-methylenetetrahydrofolate dehydrogenase/5,10-methenyltetrahydrofolate cyclohydrolase n=1 Tax=Atopobium fossor TaxID=39487 RepID=UPI00040238BA|nr:bifunctional 5,10-methylenetetrahydrofolate dehydrogenase/5,10-methenyltetrahydrofolate cyclohydrolase [Atopobium fossor]
MTQLLRGAPVAKQMQEQSAARVAALVQEGITPTLALVRVGNRPDDLSYERGILKRAHEACVQIQTIMLPQDCITQDVLDAVVSINKDPHIHGALLFRPMPHHIDQRAVCAALDPQKDVDGITQDSLYGTFACEPVGFAPCTAEAVIRMLDFYEVVLEGTQVAVVGRSLVVGRPLAALLLARNATPTICHSKTQHLEQVCAHAQVVVVATGHPQSFSAVGTNAKQVVVDVGIHWDEDAQKLVGDVDFANVKPIVAAISPVPGGVGSLTTAVLIDHVVTAAERSIK